jgi:uncharacterized protein with HEPN domain
MFKKDSTLLLKDIIESINDIQAYIHLSNFDAFYTDKKTQDAVIRKLEVVGEAANRIPKLHLDRLWRIATTYLPPLKITLEKIITDLEKN